jgi:hypothetical protein
MPFKSDKQRKWMHANEPDMAKKWEKEESINEASYKVNHAEFDHIVQLLMEPELWGDNLKGKKQGFGGIKRSYQKLSKEFYKHGIKGIGKLFKTYHKLPNKTKLYSFEDFWEKWLKRQGYRVVFESVNETSIEESIREKIRGIIKRELEATTTSAVSPYDTPLAFSKSTQRAIDVDDEDDEDEILGGQRKESFPVESISEAPMATRATLKRLGSELNKASETIIKIIDKYKKKADVDGMVKIWMRGLHLRLKKSRIKFESINEKIAKPYSNHLRKAQEEIEYMISNGPAPDGDDGVYDRPNQAMKLLQIAQKSLGKIK